jgi:WD40 repeat protein
MAGTIRTIIDRSAPMLSPCRCAALTVLFGAAILWGGGPETPPESVVVPLQMAAKEMYELQALAVSPDGKTLAVGMWQQKTVTAYVQVFSLPGGKHLHTFEGKGGHVGGLTFAPDNTLLAAGIGGAVQRWEMPSGKALSPLKPSHQGLVARLQFTADGKNLVGLSRPTHVIVWNLATGAETGCYDCKLPFPANYGFLRQLHVDGDTATVTHEAQGMAKKIDLKTGQEIALLKSFLAKSCRAFSPDGQEAFSHYDGGSEPLLIAWDLARGKAVEVASCDRGVLALAAAGDGKLAAGFDDGTVRIWDRASRQALASFRAHLQSVTQLAFSPDGRTLVTGALPCEVKLWNLAKLPRPAPPAVKKDPGPKENQPPDKEQLALAGKARQVLKTHCYRCHGQDGAAEGGFNFVLDRDRLVESKRIVPGKTAQSRLYKRVAGEEMPPEDEKVRPSAEDIATLKQWITAGAPNWAGAPKARAPISLKEVAQAVEADRNRHDPKDHIYLRYLMITHLYNAGQAEDELQTVRLAIAKVINSVSGSERIAAPVPIDAAKTVLRIDLRDYQLRANDWTSQVEARHPYGLGVVLDPKKPVVKLPIRGDWFVFAASRPPMYHALVGTPWTAAELEKQLKVDVAGNIKSGRILRAAFNGSGISRNNRLIERHQAQPGYYWRSYDFAGSTGRQNLFAFPQGPAPGPKTFLHDGGEIIYQLPNGLQAYMLVDNRGNRLDKAPNTIVSDPKHPERVVQNGISCMSCHTGGLIEKADQIRPHIDKNPGAFPADEQKAILALYPPAEQFLAVLRQDADAFQKAAALTGFKAGTTEPIVVTALRFEAELDLRQAATELWLTPEALLGLLDDFPSLARPLGALRTEGGTIQRQVFIRYFPALVQYPHLAEYVAPSWDDARRDGGLQPPAREVPVAKGDPFLLSAFQDAAYKGKANTNYPPPAVDPSLTWVAASGDGKSVRVYDVHTGELLATLKSPATLSSLAFSPDGKLLASGSHDSCLRLWNWRAGELVREIKNPGPGLPIWALAFSADGTRLAATGFKNLTVGLWETATGKELHAFKGNLKVVNRVALSPDGKTLLSGDGGSHLAVWDLAGAKPGDKAGPAPRPRAVLNIAKDVLLGLAVSPDNKRFATSTVSGTIALWDLATCDQIGADRLTNHGQRKEWNHVHSLAYSPDGAYLASAHEDGTITLWSAATLRDLFTFQAHRDNTLRAVLFSPDGTRLVSSGCDGTVRVWDVPQILKAAAARE